MANDSKRIAKVRDPISPDSPHRENKW